MTLRTRPQSPHDRSHDYNRIRKSYPPAVIRKIVHSCERRQAFLDVGTGTGILAFELAKHFEQSYGVDSNLQRIRVARSLNSELKPSDQIQFKISGAEGLPFSARKFDLITVAQAFHWFDHQKSLQEFHRVLRPGGILALLWKYPHPKTPLRRIAKRCIPNLRVRDMTDQLVRTVSDELLQGAGFQKARLWRYSSRFRYAFEDWATLMIGSPRETPDGSTDEENLQFRAALKTAVHGKFKGGLWETFDSFLFITRKSD
ncbi:MAG: methyltransferase domain-containing protein [Bdellovibrionales bacterium]|nr:methyltransferase domain-containing protein [Bdellovibrionales bacterium]